MPLDIARKCKSTDAFEIIAEFNKHAMDKKNKKDKKGTGGK